MFSNCMFEHRLNESSSTRFFFGCNSALKAVGPQVLLYTSLPFAYKCRPCSYSLMMLVCLFKCVSIWMFGRQHSIHATCACCLQKAGITAVDEQNNPFLLPPCVAHSIFIFTFSVFFYHIPSFSSFVCCSLSPLPILFSSPLPSPSPLLFRPYFTHHLYIPPPSFCLTLSFHPLLCLYPRFSPILPLSLPLMLSSSRSPFISSSPSPPSVLFSSSIPPSAYPPCSSLPPPSLPSLFFFLPPLPLTCS